MEDITEGENEVILLKIQKLGVYEMIGYTIVLNFT